MRAKVCLLAVVAICGCRDDKASTKRIAAYESTDPCSRHTDETECNADVTEGCSWFALGIPCTEGTECPSGVCQAPDPCRAHGDQGSCEADSTCAWAAVELCPPPGDTCPDGFCYTKSDGCACVCPAFCPAGEDCPDCQCDCPPDDGGGDDCTCVCPDCPDGTTCPPCDCSCDGGGGSGCGESTCTCVCEACPAGEECPPCACDCGPSTPPPSTCECTPCADGETCPPCECPTDDPCLAHGDETACLDDSANECQWIALGAPCFEGEPCLSGVCQGPFTGDPGGGDGCVCVCPECAPGESCPPCDCGAIAGEAGTSGGGSPGSGG